jgi:hypothetical protein
LKISDGGRWGRQLGRLSDQIAVPKLCVIELLCITE